MSSELFSEVNNLKRVEEELGAGTRGGVNANEALQMIRTIGRLRKDNRKLVGYKEATGQFFFRDHDAGFQRLQDLANQQVAQEEIDEGYLSRLSGELAGLSDEEWERVKRIREG